MISEADISQALTTRLFATPGLPDIVWENNDSVAGRPRPYLVAEITRVSTVDVTLDSENTIHNGYMTVTIISELGTFATPSERLAHKIVERFYKSLRLSIPGGQVLIFKPSEVGDGFRDGPDWRLPVRIDYEAS